MNLFRPYSTEPQHDENGRLIGIDRYQDVLGRNWKRFFLSGLAAMVGFLPLAFGCTYAILSTSTLVLVPASLLGGAIAGPFLACLYDCILRALRDAPGSWWQNYQKALRQNWKAAVLPGALLGLLLGAIAFTAMLLYTASGLPDAGVVVVYLFSCFLVVAIVTLYWPQLVLFEQTPALRLRNALLFFLKYFWRCCGVVLLQLVWWLAFVLFAPWSLFLLPLVGNWFILFVTLFLLYDKLDAALQIESSTQKQYPEQLPPRD